LKRRLWRARMPFFRISRSTHSLLAGNLLSRSSRTMRGDPQALFSSVLMA
jgi:hypothetical protein